jgi:hypothetical protein
MAGVAVDAVLAPPKVAPTQPIMTACEVLFWIGLGIIKTSQELHDEMMAFLERWTCLPADSVLKALEGRAATEPYCAIGILTLDGEPDVRYAHPFLSPNGPRALRRLRAKARHREQRHVSYGELASLLADELSAEARESTQLESAAAELLKEIRAERVTAWGQPDIKWGKPNPGAVHQRIPVEIFMYPAMSVTILDQVRPDHNAPVEQWVNWKGPNFSGVQFKTAEILAIWPMRENADPMAAQRAADDASDELRRQYAARQFASPFWTVWGVISWVGVRRPDGLQLFDRAHFLDIPWKLEESDAAAILDFFAPPKPAGDEAHLDVSSAGQVTVQFVTDLHEQLALALGRTGLDKARPGQLAGSALAVWQSSGHHPYFVNAVHIERAERHRQACWPRPGRPGARQVPSG